MSSAMLASAPSELDRHTETIPEEARADESEDTWACAGADESLESFMNAFAPSKTSKAWISTQHDGRKALLSKYYTELAAAEGEDESEGMGDIQSAWDALETKCVWPCPLVPSLPSRHGPRPPPSYHMASPPPPPLPSPPPPPRSACAFVAQCPLHHGSMCFACRLQNGGGTHSDAEEAGQRPRQMDDFCAGVGGRRCVGKSCACAVGR